jgi:hypothetical protein
MTDEEYMCNICNGSDENPPQHCMDCQLLDHIPPHPASHPQDKGCFKCGFTGYASGKIHDRVKDICIKCGCDPVNFIRNESL